MANGSEKGEGESPFPSLSIHLRKKGGERQTDAAAIFSQSGERREVFSPLSILRRQFLFAREGGHFRKEPPQPETSLLSSFISAWCSTAPVNTPFFLS